MTDADLSITQMSADAAPAQASTKTAAASPKRKAATHLASTLPSEL